MASGYGMCGHVMLNFQDNYGTSQVTSLSAVPIISESLTHTIEPLIEAGMYARFGESPYHEGTHAVEGSISLEPEPSALGWFLKSVMGTVDTTSDTNDQTHVFVPPVNCSSEFSDRAAVQPLTAEVYRDVGSAFLYYDLLGNDFSLSMANGELLTMETNFVGAGFTRKAGATPTFPTGKPFVWDQFSGSYNGADITDLKDITVTINNNLEAVHTLTGSKAPYRIKRSAQQQVEISGTFVFASHSYQQAFEAQAENSMIFNFTNAVSPHQFTMDFSKVRFKTFEATMGGPELVEASFTAGAMFDTSSNRSCTFTLINTQTYY